MCSGEKSAKSPVGNLLPCVDIGLCFVHNLESGRQWLCIKLAALLKLIPSGAVNFDIIHDPNKKE